MESYPRKLSPYKFRNSVENRKMFFFVWLVGCFFLFFTKLILCFSCWLLESLMPSLSPDFSLWRSFFFRRFWNLFIHGIMRLLGLVNIFFFIVLHTWHVLFISRFCVDQIWENFLRYFFPYSDQLFRKLTQSQQGNIHTHTHIYIMYI